MATLITDEMLQQWAVSAADDDLAARLTQRCAGLFDTVMLDLPPSLRQDPARVAELVRAVHEA